jgi:hypothetical protein
MKTIKNLLTLSLFIIISFSVQTQITGTIFRNINGTVNANHIELEVKGIDVNSFIGLTLVTKKVYQLGTKIFH